jgi:aminoglycoside phosphotransferase (APT) family kinase protein
MIGDSMLHYAELIAARIDPGCTVIRAWQLEGGVSAQVMAFETVDSNGDSQKMIVRQHGAIDFAHNPRIAFDEFKLLRTLYDEELPVPQPYFLDESNDILPTPYLVTAFVDADSGLPDISPEMISLHMATRLAEIHAVDWRAANLSFLPAQRDRFAQRVRNRPERLENSLSESRIRDHLVAHLPLSQLNAPVLLHGDYWPGNTMWRDGNLIAVIDWEDAAVGDPLADVANCRLELLWAYGAASMESFTSQYLEMTSIEPSNLPLWDLYAALGPASKLSEWGLDAETEQRMRIRHADFVEQAIAQLSTKPLPIENAF